MSFRPADVLWLTFRLRVDMIAGGGVPGTKVFSPQVAVLRTDVACPSHCTSFSLHCCFLGLLGVSVTAPLTLGKLVYNVGLAETQQLVSEALMQMLHTAAAPSKTAGRANLTQTMMISNSRHLLSGSSAVQAADTVSTPEVTPEHVGLTASGTPAVLLQ